MKKLFNSHLPNGKLNEVVLFDHMTKLFTNKKTTAIFIKRAHQTYVKFSLNRSLKKIRREIGDLIFLVLINQPKHLKFVFFKPSTENKDLVMIFILMPNTINGNF